MDYKIIISTDAEKDTNEAYQFYENEHTGLGDRFLNELTDFYEKLKHHPTYYSFVSKEKNIRGLVLKVFPYKIIYEIEGKEIYVFAIYHFRQHPDQFLKRL
jgi:plasmid stabilization system protein ParE